MLDLNSDSGGPIVNLYALCYLWDTRKYGEVTVNERYCITMEG